jgi:hypothetical protein
MYMNSTILNLTNVSATIEAYTNISHNTKVLAAMGIISSLIIVVLVGILADREVNRSIPNSEQEFLERVKKITAEWFDLLKWFLIISGIFIAAKISKDFLVLIIGFVSVIIFIIYTTIRFLFLLEKPIDHLMKVDQAIPVNGKIPKQKKIAVILSVLLQTIITAVFIIILIKFMPQLLNDIK